MTFSILVKTSSPAPPAVLPAAIEPNTPPSIVTFDKLTAKLAAIPS